MDRSPLPPLLEEAGLRRMWRTSFLPATIAGLRVAVSRTISGACRCETRCTKALSSP